jgi:hypothetical protein
MKMLPMLHHSSTGTALSSVALASIFLAATGCQLPALQCEDRDGEPLTGAITSGWAQEPIFEDHTVEGSLSTSEFVADLALGLRYAALGEGTNYHTWSVTLPIEYLREIGEIPGTGEECSHDPLATCATLELVAMDACGNRRPVEDGEGLSAQLRLPVAPASRAIEDLEIALEMPDDDCYLPADGSRAAALVLTAEGAAAGAVVTLAVTDGALVGVNADGQITLEPIDDRAEATAWLSAPAEEAGGYARVTFQGEGVCEQSVLAQVAPAPVFTPASASLAPDQAFRVAITSEGRIGVCRAFPTHPGAASAVPAGTATDLTLETHDFTAPADDGDPDDDKVDCGDQQVEFVDILFLASATEASSITLSCADTLGQIATATYQVTVDEVECEG